MSKENIPEEFLISILIYVSIMMKILERSHFSIYEGYQLSITATVYDF